jgi:hypothetical protein
MPTKEQAKEQARRRKANQRARDKGMPEPYPVDQVSSAEEQSGREKQHLLDLAFAMEQDATGNFYRSECRPLHHLLGIYEGNNNVNGEDDKVDPKTGKKKHVAPNPSIQAVRIRAIEQVEGEFKVLIDPDMKQYRKTYEVNGVVTFREWLELRDKARKDLFWLGRLLDRSFFHGTHQQMCDMFVKKNFDGLFFPDFNSDDVHDAIRTQKQYRKDANGSQTDTMMLFAPRSSYKSTIDGVDIVQWMINCPDVRVMILTSVLDLSLQFLSEIKGYFNQPVLGEVSAFRLLFPEYVLKGIDGTSEQPIVCPARTYTSKEPHVWVTSLDASFVGQRCDIRKLDDCVDDKNSATEELRNKLTGKISSTNALAEPWGFTDIIGTRYFTTDWYAYRMTSQDGEEVEPFLYMNLSAWTPKPECTVKYEALLAETNGMFKVTEDMVDLFFPSKLHFKELRKRLREYKERGFKNQYLNIATDPLESTEFAVHFEREVLRSHTYARSAMPKTGEKIVCIDWAYSENKTSDFSVLAAILRHEREDQTEELVVEDIDYDKWKASDLALRIVLFLRKHNPSRTFIEKSNGIELLILAIRAQLERFGWQDLEKSIQMVPTGNTKNEKANRIKTLEILLADDRLHFVSGTWIDDLYKQFERFTGESTKMGRKDDIPDAISRASRTLPPSMFTSVRVDPETQALEQDEEDKRLAKERHRQMYFGDSPYSGTHSYNRSNPPQPTLHPPTWRERATGVRKDTPPLIEENPEPAKPQDPRMRLFGKGPWRL